VVVGEILAEAVGWVFEASVELMFESSSRLKKLGCLGLVIVLFGGFAALVFLKV
jgi:hypothetical protein